MVDMSVTILHHGHIRLLKKASKLGNVIVGLVTDKEVQSKKGYTPEISFKYRKEILESIKYVYEVVPTPWLVDDKVLRKYNIDLLVHGSDNSNLVPKKKLKIFPRTRDTSSTDIRSGALLSFTQINNQKLMLTPGPASVLYENIKNLKPLYDRGDREYEGIFNNVMSWIKKISQQDDLIAMQGSSTFAIELALSSFVSGNVLIISTGFYSDRLKVLSPKNCKITFCSYEKINNINTSFDWILCVYADTSSAIKVDLKKVKNLADKIGAKLFVDAAASIGLEANHGLADLLTFSSYNGLFGLTGAAFIAHKSDLKNETLDRFYLNIETHRQKLVTGPCHAIASLNSIVSNHQVYKQRVLKSKNAILEKYNSKVRKYNQPILCTYLDGKVIPNDENVVLYEPKTQLSGSVICHLGEIHQDEVKLINRISLI